MKRRSPEVDAFLREIIAVFKKHNMALSPERDFDGQYEIIALDELNLPWLMAAKDVRTKARRRGT